MKKARHGQGRLFRDDSKCHGVERQPVQKVQVAVVEELGGVENGT